MKVVLFGATGMVGQGALRECLLDARVERVLTVGRKATGQAHPKLHEVTVPDLFELSMLAEDLTGYDACFFCLGVTSNGLTEAAYRRLTHDLAASIGALLAAQNPGMTMVFVSGAGSDSTEKGRLMWARVKGMAENALLALPFKAAYMLRPGIIRPLHGIQSRTRLYRISYRVLGPLVALVQRVFPNSVTTTEQMGRAMIALAAEGYPKRILEMPDINAL